VKARSTSSATRYAGLGALTAALLAGSALVASPVDALPAPPSGAVCRAGDPGPAPAARRIADTPAVSAATLDRVRREAATTSRSTDGSARTLSGARTAALPVYRVRVQMHVIHGKHAGEHKVKPAAVRRLFGILQAAYDGKQSVGAAEPMGVIFDLKRITVTRNEAWYHARPMSRADRKMKRTLHRGGAQTLNIYITAPKYPGGSILLGYSRFPWQYAARPKLDGVTVNVAGMPGGRATGYNLGDTVVHETGHWLGLLHTFQSSYRDGCSDPWDDGVRDTPKERGPNFRCSDSANVCNVTDLATMYDPAVNFMEYTYDSCMRLFTAGQHARFAQMYATYRFGR
jgi:hypothetical protein